MKTNHTIHVLHLAIALVLFATAHHSQARPNIVFILADDVGAESMDRYGGTSWPTPNINSIADNGMLFENAYSCPTCASTRAQFLTGRYQFRHGITWPNLPNGPLSVTGETSLAKVIQRSGYNTGFVGKWHLYHSTPPDPNADDGGLQATHLQAHGYAEHKTFLGGAIRYGSASPESEFVPYQLNQWACDFIRRKAGEPEPFYLQYSMGLVHWEREADMVKKLSGTPLNPTANPNNTSNIDLYRNMMTYMDNMVGNIMDTLDEAGIADNTVLVFAGDNGTWPIIWSQWNGRSVQGGKNTIKDTSSWVPFHVRWPGVVEPGSTYAGMTDFADIFPTFIEIAGATVPNYRPIDGISFLPQLAGEPEEHRQIIYSGQGYGNYSSWSNTFEFAREKNYKLLYGQWSTDGLYDVSQSPLRETLIPVSSQTPEQLAARTRLQAFLDQVHAKQLTETGADSDRDGQTDFQETAFGTDPVTPSSLFQPELVQTTGTYALRFQSTRLHRYQILHADSLTSSEWIPLPGTVTGTGAEVEIPLPAETANRFFKILATSAP